LDDDVEFVEKENIMHVDVDNVANFKANGDY